jgi:hypothetical protein
LTEGRDREKESDRYDSCGYHRTMI